METRTRDFFHRYATSSYPTPTGKAPSAISISIHQTTESSGLPSTRIPIKKSCACEATAPRRSEARFFLKSKKKFDGVVYKRRIAMTLGEAKEYLAFAKKPADTQIMREIDQAMKFYGWPAPRISLSYEREAFYSAASPDLRLTFDTGIRYRETEVSLEAGTAGKPLIRSGEHLLEIKTEGAMPLWLSRALDENGIFPTSFSKYGTAYLTGLAETKSSAEKGDFIYA